MPNPVIHWEIVSNTRGEELQRFYAELFGWEVRADNPLKYGLVDRQTERGIAGGIGPTEGPSRVTIYAEVDDPQAYLDRAVSLGATVLLPVTEMPGVGVTLALFADPAGIITGLLKGGTMPDSAEQGNAAPESAEPAEAGDAEPDQES